jgi:hypothetical protein
MRTTLHFGPLLLTAVTSPMSIYNCLPLTVLDDTLPSVYTCMVYKQFMRGFCEEWHDLWWSYISAF